MTGQQADRNAATPRSEEPFALILLQCAWYCLVIAWYFLVRLFAIALVLVVSLFIFGF